MDFSFVGSDAGLQRKQQSGGGQAGGAPAPAAPAAAAPAAQQPAGARPGAIAIPSFREVQAAERQRAQPPHFRPSAAAGGSAAAAGVRPGADVNPFAFIGGGPSPPRPAARPHQQQQQQQPGMNAWRPQGAPPPYQQQQQHQQHQRQQYQQQQHPQPQPQPQRPRFLSPQSAQPPPGQALPGQMRPPGPALQQAPRPVAAAPALQPHQPFPANAIIVSKRQEGNPVLRYIRNVRWQFGDITPDYLVGRDAAVLFLSLRYHLLKPEYIHHRIRELQRAFRLRVILCHVDAEDAAEPLAQVTRAALGNECTLVCGWSNAECARYLETFKSYENKPAEVIQKDLGSDYVSRANAALTSVRGVNRTDVKTLGDRFGSIAAIFRAPAEELQACPGIGPTKARRLHEAFHQPFRRSVAASAAAAAAAAGVQQQQAQQQQAAVAAAAAATAEEKMQEAGEEEEEWPDEDGEEAAGEGSGGGSGGGGSGELGLAAGSELAPFDEDEEDESEEFL